MGSFSLRMLGSDPRAPPLTNGTTELCGLPSSGLQDLLTVPQQPFASAAQAWPPIDADLYGGGLVAGTQKPSADSAVASAAYVGAGKAQQAVAGWTEHLLWNAGARAAAGTAAAPLPLFEQPQQLQAPLWQQRQDGSGGVGGRPVITTHSGFAAAVGATISPRGYEHAEAAVRSNAAGSQPQQVCQQQQRRDASSGPAPILPPYHSAFSLPLPSSSTEVSPTEAQRLLAIAAGATTHPPAAGLLSQPLSALPSLNDQPTMGQCGSLSSEDDATTGGVSS